MLDERGGRRREQDLAAVGEVGDPGRLVDRVADVAVLAQGGLAGVEADSHPARADQGPLRGDGGCDRRPRARKGNEEGVPVAVDLDPAVLGEGLPEQLVVLREQRSVTLAPELFQQPCRAFDVGKEKGDRPRREVAVPSHLAL